MDESGETPNGDERAGSSQRPSSGERSSGTPKNTEIPDNAKGKPKALVRVWMIEPIGKAADWLDRHNGLVTAFATIAIAALTYSLATDSAEQARIGNGQLDILRRQLNEIKQTRISSDQSTADQLNVLRTQAVATQAQADASKIAAETARLAMTASQRAWLGPTNASISQMPALGEPVTVDVSYSNVGREPATSVFRDVTAYKIGGNFTADGGATNQILRIVMLSCRSKVPVGDGQVAWPTSNGVGFSLTQNLPAGTLDAIVTDDNLTLVITGCFAYMTFGQPRHTSFCYFLQKKAPKIDRLSICQGGNYAD